MYHKYNIIITLELFKNILFNLFFFYIITFLFYVLKNQKTQNKCLIYTYNNCFVL